MSSENFKVINFDPNLNFEDLNYNVEKFNNSITQDLDFNLETLGID